MAGKKESFVMMYDWYDLLEDFTLEQKGQVLDAVYKSEISEEVNLDDYDAITKPAIRYILKQIARNNEKYQQTLDKRAAAGRKGGIAKGENAEKAKIAKAKSAKNKQTNLANLANANFAKNKKAKIANAKFAKHTDADADADAVSDSVADAVSDSVADAETDAEAGAVYDAVADMDNSSEQSRLPSHDVEALPLNNGDEWKPTDEQYAEYVRLYPAVDVPAQFRAMRGWLLSNPKRRKTSRGICNFVNSWLSREQDKPHVRSKPTGTMTEKEYLDYWEKV